ncbi:ligase-associated DNA damage response DEXH box helicase [Bartonella sp. HY329]|uniref:ligase-associated DNA damage response DEXH box helicase n=1 Tax=unclassified Bartonella TaxID=2645622 RepID=UPI0021C6A11A|nr:MULTISPECIES: ligase-associated DNA damage response DEXH box helicase [unclassified Bartonella]UXM95443.1 ligase-associated DNA damage response DEXH box helicase [Bartonella sp. HY329]UXN09768.1 ligase-associated DNA damage response DEXH box helicase [Bartonella sp. HY328]
MAYLTEINIPAPIDKIDLLPEKFKDWFLQKNWQPRPHQLALIEKADKGLSTLLIAPTGAGKTLAGFLPSLISLFNLSRTKTKKTTGIHTLYISPLKALAVDIHRNLATPIAEMALDVSIETRTGDTPQHKRQRQKITPPDILLTTPEQLALLLAANDAKRFFDDLKFVIFDELHALHTSKRGHLLSLGLARLFKLQPNLQTIGLSATVSDPDDLRGWLVPQNCASLKNNLAELVTVKGGVPPQITILKSHARLPWAGHSARYALPDIYDVIKTAKTTLIFVNTRSQAEMVFQELWRLNEDNLPIALHHGSLDVARRRKVEEAMSRNSLKAIVATSTLDLGIDWGDVDLVVHIGAPKGASRLAQRIGRSNHRLDEASKAILVPANCFEVLECQAALDANYIGAQDSPNISKGALDVLAQHVLGMAIAAPFDADNFYDEVTSSIHYKNLSRIDFDRILDFVATGGYALKAYENFAKIRKNKEGLWQVSNAKISQQYRLNIGTIIEAAELQVRLIKKGSLKRTSYGGKQLGKIEEGFVESLENGDTFLFAGYVLRFEGIRDNQCFVSLSPKHEARIPSYAGGKFPLSTFLAAQVRAMLAKPQSWQKLPDAVRHWLEMQQQKSILPAQNELLIETFQEKKQHFLVAYPFEGRLAHQTLGMLLTKRLDRMGLNPLGFVATDYSIALWGLNDLNQAIASKQLDLSALLSEDMLGDDLEAWLEDSHLLKRSFRNCAIISGLINRRHFGTMKTGRQVTISTDLVYDVLRNHQKDHILLKATRQDAAHGLLDIARLGDMLARIKNHIHHHHCTHISPLALPVIMEIGREMIPGSGRNLILEELAQEYANFDFG